MDATFFESVLHISNVSVTLGANLLAQSGLLAAAGLLAAWILRHKGAALRSAILRVTLAAILLCPLASLGLKTLGIRGLTFTVPRAAMQAVGVPVPVASEPVGLAELGIRQSPRSLADQSTIQNPYSAFRIQHSAITIPPVASSQQTPPPRLTGLALFYITVAALWWMGSGLLLARLLRAHVRMSSVRREAHEGSSALSAMCDALARDMAVRSPAVLTSPLVHSPCLIGLLRPAILLPTAETVEDPLMSREVILHELAHMARGDCALNLLGRIARAVLCFQPLLWQLTSRVEQSSDEVADDYVIHHKSERGSYAQLLVDVAKQFKPLPAEAAAGLGVIFGESSLGRRVERILDTSRTLSVHIGVPTAVVVIALALCATLATGLISAGDRLGAIAEELLETASAYRDEAEGCVEQNDHQRAIEAYYQAIGVLWQLTDERPDVADYEKELALTWNSSGNVLWQDMGRRREAADAYGEAAATFEMLVEEYPDEPEYRRDLAWSYVGRARTLTEMGQHQDAVDLCRQAIAIAEQLVVELPANPDYQAVLAEAQSSLGQLLENTGRTEEAEEAWYSVILATISYW